MIIDDDPDDREMIQRVLNRLDPDQEYLFFSDSEDALHHLQHEPVKPSLIICDINMPLMNGLEFREHIQSSEYLSRKCIPFVFLTTTANPMQVRHAYELSVHGFFIKGSSYDELKEALTLIIKYWKRSTHL